MNTPRPTPPVHAPHTPLTEYYQTEQDRQAYLRQMFDNTAADYDHIEAIFAWGSGSRYRRQALVRAGLKTGMKVLDVGAGTGLVAAQACILTGDAALVTGVDPSPGMMAAAKLPVQNIRRSRPVQHWLKIVRAHVLTAKRANATQSRQTGARASRSITRCRAGSGNATRRLLPRGSSAPGRAD